MSTKHMDRRVLWVGDAVVATGFSRITHHVLAEVVKTWDVYVLGLNYLGDPHMEPYPIFPAWPGGDAFGTRRLPHVLDAVNPHVIVIQNDPWNVPFYIKAITTYYAAHPELSKPKIIAALAVDGLNCRGGEYLEGVDHCIFWTKFGMMEAQRGGYKGPVSVIPLGVDTELYKPMDRLEARKSLGFPDFLHEAFIVGNVNRNQPRKRLDLCVEYFAEWIKKDDIKDAFLYLQICPTGDLGYDVKQLKHYHDPGSRPWMLVTEPPIGMGVHEEMLPAVYSAFDIQFTTTQGEGWGLTTMEGMACGIPQLVPVWSALGEWADAALGIKCSTTAVTPNKTNTIGGIPDKAQAIAGLRQLYSNRKLRQQLSFAGRELACRSEYRWETIGAQYVQVLEEVVKPKEEAVA